MSIQVVNLTAEDGITIFCPFSGQIAIDPDSLKTAPGLRFCYYGDVSSYEHIHPDVEINEDLSLEELADSLELPNAVMFIVDEGWNGINAYCFQYTSEG